MSTPAVLCVMHKMMAKCIYLHKKQGNRGLKCYEIFAFVRNENRDESVNIGVGYLFFIDGCTATWYINGENVQKMLPFKHSK